MNKLSVAVQAALAALVVVGCASGPGSYSGIVPVQRISGEGAADAWYQLGRYHQGQERLAQAEVAFRRVLKLDAGHAEAHNALGAVLAGQGKLAAAEAEFRAAAQSAPRAAHVQGNLGRILLLQGKTDEAILVLEEGLRLDPDNRNVRSNLVAALEASGIVEPARRAMASVDTTASARAVASEPVAATPLPMPQPVVVETKTANSVVVLPAVPVTDSRAAVKVVEPLPAPVVVSASGMSYQDVRAQGAVTVVATRSSENEVQIIAPLPATAVPQQVANEAPVVVATAAPAAAPLAEAVAAPLSVPVSADPVPAALSASEAGPVVSPSAVAAGGPVPAAEASPAAPVAEASPAPAVVAAAVSTALPATEASPAPVADLVPAPAAERSPLPAAVASPLSPAAVSPEPPRAAVAVTTAPGQALASASTERFRLEVSNGNGVEGMARRVRGTLADKGFGRIRVTNDKPYRAEVTVVQFREGFEPQASSLARRFPQSAKVVYKGRLDSRADVRVVLGRDLPRSFALNASDLEAPAMLALVGADK